MGFSSLSLFLSHHRFREISEYISFFQLSSCRLPTRLPSTLRSQELPATELEVSLSLARPPPPSRSPSLDSLSPSYVDLLEAFFRPSGRDADRFPPSLLQDPRVSLRFSSTRLESPLTHVYCPVAGYDLPPRQTKRSYWKLHLRYLEWQQCVCFLVLFFFSRVNSFEMPASTDFFSLYLLSWKREPVAGWRRLPQERHLHHQQ